MNKNAFGKFIYQHDETDCGVACLLSIIKYYGGEGSLERLRELSGTSIQGTSLLGLQQAANQYGISAEAFEVDDLEVFRKEATFPCILHVVVQEQLEHYVICLNSPEQDSVEIFDPAVGFETWTLDKFLNAWKSRAVLILQPNQQFKLASSSAFDKMNWFKSILKADFPIILIAIFLGIILSILSMSTAVFSQKLIDEILPKQQLNKLWLGLGLLLLLSLARSFINYLRTFFLLRQSKDFNIRLLDAFYSKLLVLPQNFFNTRKTGEIIARINDSRRIQSLINFFTGNVVIDVLIVLVGSIFLFTYSIKIGLIAILSIPLFVFLIWRFNNQFIINQKKVMNQYAISESHFVDSISGIATVKSTNREPFFSKIGSYFYQLFQEKNYELGLIGNRYNFWTEFINSFLIVIILLYSSLQVLQTTLKIGEMMAIISIASAIINSVARLVTTNIQVQEAKVAFERMYEFTSLTPEYDDQYTVPKKTNKIKVESIRIKRLSFRFPGKSQLLKNINISVKTNEIVALKGEIGSGKSILMQILQKFLAFEDGEIVINDTHNLNDIDSFTWRNSIGIVPQEVKIFNSTLIDNIVLGDVINEGDDAVAFCKEIGFHHFFENLPQGYFTIVGEDGIHLSGGQKQLVALARTLFRRPSLLILDEATSAMDKKTENFVLDLISKIKKDCCIIMVNHRLSIESKVDRVYLLENGVIS